VEESVEAMIGIQKVRRDMKKLKDIIDTIVEEAESESEAEAEEGEGGGEEVEEADEGEDEARNQERRRRQGKFTKRLSSILNLLSPETIETYFGTTNHEDIWRELNTDAGHRSKVIEWLDAMRCSRCKCQEKLKK
jgi:hypothetical protein